MTPPWTVVALVSVVAASATGCKSKSPAPGAGTGTAGGAPAPIAQGSSGSAAPPAPAPAPAIPADPPAYEVDASSGIALGVRLGLSLADRAEVPGVIVKILDPKTAEVYVGQELQLVVRTVPPTADDPDRVVDIMVVGRLPRISSVGVGSTAGAVKQALGDPSYFDLADGWAVFSSDGIAFDFGKKSNVWDTLVAMDTLAPVVRMRMAEADAEE